MGKDGRVRGAVLKLPAKDGQTTLLRRPLQLLYPLEINCQIGEQTSAAQDSNGGEPEQFDEVPSEHATRRRSQRTAARQANDQLKACLFELNEN